jgi:acyl-CoA synthetase (AMP-forming)/AMP-acid ligase II
MRVGMIEARGNSHPAFINAAPDLPAFFAQCCALYAERDCLVDDAERLSFAQVHARARRVAAGLITRHGVNPGDPVGLAARNGAGWVIAYMGIAMAGGVATLVNAFWTGAEMVAAIRDVGCLLVLADRFRLEALKAAPEESGARLVLLDLDGGIDESLARLDADDAGVIFPMPGPDAPATLLFTSGSTGQCKGALSDHRAKVQATLHFACTSLSVATLLAQRGAAPDHLPATLLNLPLFHVTGEVNVMLQSFALGRKMVVMRRWDSLEALRLIEAEYITYMTGVPLMGIELADHPRRSAFDLSSLANLAAGGAPRPVEHIARLRAGLPLAGLLYGYGLTETNAIGTGIIGETLMALPHSPGKATAPLVALAIFGEDGTMLDPGEEGEIGLRSIANISGYWDRPEDNARLFTPSGHLLTGDLGRLDEDGYLTIVGRKKDIIIRGGENISCLDVEEALYGIAGMRECAVFGVPDARLGEVPVAIVYLDVASALDAAAIEQALVGRLAAFKRPSRIVLADKLLPRLGSEKIDKRALREAYLAERHAFIA